MLAWDHFDSICLLPRHGGRFKTMGRYEVYLIPMAQFYVMTASYSRETKAKLGWGEVGQMLRAPR